MKKKLLPLNPSSISGEGFIFTDNSMAGNDDDNWIEVICSSNSSYRFWIANQNCLIKVATSFSVGDSGKCVPCFLLKFGTGEKLIRNGENFPFPLKIFIELLLCLLKNCGCICIVDSTTLLKTQKLFFEFFPI